ncbi:3-keto-disaccharide hydrolase [Sunxiuqinia sp. A32]|uniref:3-keto-disaccharide hydrolase n=1 Tax=Sunxiuqinia sp. A32 TaxID=3461496 RepID=UPI0040455A5B
MKHLKSISTFLFVSILLFSSCVEKTTEPKVTVPDAEISQFLGQWTIDVDGGGVSWLEVRQEDQYLDGAVLWIGGSVVPVSFMYLGKEALYVIRDTRKVVRTTTEDGEADRVQMISTWLEVKKDGDKIAGYYIRPKRDGMGLDSTAFVGTKLPDVPAAPDLSAIKYGDPIKLFNGTDLTGWKLVEPDKANGWSVVDNTLVNDPVHTEGETVHYGNLRTEQEFEDFNLKIEANIPPHNNSGIYLRGRHEIQVVDSYGQDLDPHNMGALYSRITPSESAEKPAGSWQSFDITLCDRHVTVVLNGKKIIDNQPVYGPTGGALTSDVYAPGPIYLQGDHGLVSFRNIVLTPIIK